MLGALLLFPSLVLAGGIPLPQELNVTASVAKGVRDGLWEKTLIVRFPEKRRTLSTTDGFADAQAAINHAAQPELWMKLHAEMQTRHELGGNVYVRKIQEKIADNLGVKREDVAQMSTAADMDNLAVVSKIFKPFVVTALVTAGAKTNAQRTGVDEGTYIEGDEPKGTVNILILTNARLTDGAMARALITVTEAKTAAFEDLRIPSSYTKGAQATGTGTDSIIIATGTTGPKVTYTGGHNRIGELIGKAVYEAVIEALGKQNGFRKDLPH
ncbi:MAG TPA: adenosylcobinamide amidohydrolase [Thermodesulfovibrionales bacterium]|nr:adenosylcobinamide amidohydrolase [Thermodesulfovibrionales bacterium]